MDLFWIMCKFSHSVVSNFLWPHGLQHARLPCPSPTPGACSNSCPLSRWCHPIISFSVIPFSSCLQSFPASGPFPKSQLFTLGGQSIGASASVLPMNIQDWFSLRLTGLISLQIKGLSRVPVLTAQKTWRWAEHLVSTLCTGDEAHEMRDKAFHPWLRGDVLVCDTVNVYTCEHSLHS